MKTNEQLLAKTEHIYSAMLVAEDRKKEVIASVMPSYHDSAVNLVDYLAIRAQNVEALQKQLHGLGLSSMASCESHIKAQLIHIMHWLGHDKTEAYEVDAESGFRHLEQNIDSLFGKPVKEGVPPVMVTFDTNFAEDFQLICDLLENGMQVARINCAHDDEQVWTKMIANLKKATDKMNLPCKIYIDMAGPKIRTQIISKKPKQDTLNVELGGEVILTDVPKVIKHKECICCTLEGIVNKLRPGHRVYFDDGLFEAVVQSAEGNYATLKITRISAKKPVIKSEKGINFPDTTLQINPITEYDEQCLPFIVSHADMMGFSFVNNAADMQQLQQQLARLNRPDLPIVAKIETNQAVNNLPAIILQGMQQNLTGIMIARGDLAVEIGFERLSEIQEEILWICEAAHTPVIWATQVLESMNKAGLATRSEITDAAHAAEADCVMINKGGHTVEVLKTLNDILSRSRKNNFKNRRLFRKLSIAHNFIAQN